MQSLRVFRGACSLGRGLCRRPFSATPTQHNDSSPLDQLQSTLREEGAKKNQREAASKTAKNAPSSEYQLINADQFIRPYDLSLEGRSKPQRFGRKTAKVAPTTRDARTSDVFYKLQIDPIKFALQPDVLSHYMSEMAMIYPRNSSKLTTKSQRRIAKAIKRAKMMGVIPLLSRPRNTMI